MTDLREQPAIDAAQEKAKAIFLSYYDSNPWATARIQVPGFLAALVRNPEGLSYMERETAERTRVATKFAKDNADYESQRRRAAGLEEKPNAT